MVKAVDELQQGREAYATGSWIDAYESLSQADRATTLGAKDLELLATSAYMLGRDDAYLNAQERAHRAHLDAGEALRAARCAAWLGINLMLRGEAGRASGWLARARRLVEREGRDCVEQGYLLLPLMFEHEASGDLTAAIDAGAAAIAIGERFGDPDLLALATQDRGILLIKEGRVAEGLGMLDEAMLAVTAGELSPMVSGFVYCGVIMGCQEAYELRRAREWTTALTRWCEKQPDMVSFTGTCLVHRAEIMQLHGAWPEALEEARRAGAHCARTLNQPAAAQALYRQGEVHRLRGEFAAAEKAYREASRSGREPQPGLALLRLAQGSGDAAAAAIRRLVGGASEPSRRAGLLPAYVEIMLALGDPDAARDGCRELDEIAAGYESGMLVALAAHGWGAVELAAGDAGVALAALRSAAETWQELGVPYEVARARALVAVACRALGDEETAALELEAARDGFAQLGAAPDLARIDSLGHGGDPADAHGLTARELEVLRLVAAGETNRAIAAELVLSERTVDRHVSNIFAKLGVSSRAAATAFAYEHRLL